MSSIVVDQESRNVLTQLEQRTQIEGNRVEGVRSVLIVLSSKAMVMDLDGLRHKIVLAYPEAAVFFITTSGQAMGIPAPKHVDLLVDFTGPGARQGWFYARHLRSRARFAVGRNAGLFRKRIYDRIFDEKAPGFTPARDTHERERIALKQVFHLAGVATMPTGEATQDLSKKIALDLPPLQQS
jgi:hypothetical protein